MAFDSVFECLPQPSACFLPRPFVNDFRKASFNARIFARLATSSSFSVSVLRTSTSVALPAAHPTPENETEASLPPFDSIASPSREGSTDRALAGHVATGGDRPRQGASSRQRSCRVRFMRRSQAECRVAPFPFADFAEAIFRAQLVEPGDKLERGQGRALGRAAPGMVVGVERAFRKCLSVGRRLDALGEIIDHQPQCFVGRRAVVALGHFRISRQNSRAEGGDEFDRHREQQGKPRARYREVRASRAISARATRLADRPASWRRVREVAELDSSAPTAGDRDRVLRSRPQVLRAVARPRHRSLSCGSRRAGNCWRSHRRCRVYADCFPRDAEAVHGSLLRVPQQCDALEDLRAFSRGAPLR